MKIKELNGYKNFKKECSYYYATDFYPHWVGNEKYILVSDVSENELKRKYPEIISALAPFVLIGKYFIRLNEVIEYHDKKNSLENTVSFDEIEDIENLSKALQIDDCCNELETHEQIQVALSAVNPTQKNRVIKFFYEDLSYTEIGKEEGFTRQAIEGSISRALKKMKNKLD